MRIRSIKPDFWTSEVVADWDLPTRLTFVGLWSYVDDNGVGPANERLIVSALYPMDDPHEALTRVHEALSTFSTGGQIVLYEALGKRLLYLVGWDEHQRVQHPGKPRFPRPNETPSPPPTSTNGHHTDHPHPVSGNSHEASRDSHEVLTPEQGAGSREQGGGAGQLARAREHTRALTREAGSHSATAHRLVTAYADTCTRRPPTKILTQLATETDALLAEHWPEPDIDAALTAWGTKRLGPGALQAVAHEVVNRRPQQSITSRAVAAADTAVDEWEARQQPSNVHALPARRHGA